ncbi:MAG: tRNA 2-thiouridine(34) synthase MnmA [Bacteroidaceae bacterium]|jgi:tRNA (5-methylaminomethyl-2-thiouridylate)-methyltransferase
MNIATLLSGGVDSSVVVHQLKENGVTPHCFYIKIGKDDDPSLDCTSEEDIEMASAVARKYGCPFDIIDLHREYWDNVVTYTIDKVRRGFTPNPDVMCNKLIKFGAFEQAIGHEFEKTATGHYATTALIDGKTWLATAADPIKDQTDFLCQINYSQIQKLLFPIGHLMKHEVRQIAEKEHLINAKRKDSQGICFLGKINYNDFIRRYLGERTGNIVELESGKILGQHKGFWFHTIGQRKGLYLSGGPWFVVKKDIETNTLYVARGYDPQEQYGTEFDISDFHFITENPWLDSNSGKPIAQPIEVTLKIRHTPEFTPATIEARPYGYHITVQKPLQGIAPGQFCTVYDAAGYLCIGSGEIVLR